MGKKSIAIIGEGITEWFYFDSLRIAYRYPFKVAPDFPQHSDIPHMSKLVNDYVRRQYDYVVCLVDMDRLLAHPAEMETYKHLKSKSDSCVMWVETNPCTEFWFLLHFLPSLAIRHYANQDQAIAELRKYMPGYEKTNDIWQKPTSTAIFVTMETCPVLCQMLNNCAVYATTTRMTLWLIVKFTRY